MVGGLQNDHGRSVYFLLLFCIGFGLLGVIRSTHGDGRTEFILSGICLMVFIIITIIINIEDRQAKKKNKEKAEEEEKRAKEKEAQQRMENSAKEKQKFNIFWLFRGNGGLKTATTPVFI